MASKIPFLVGLGWLLVCGGVSGAPDQTAKELFDTLPAQIRAEAEAKRNNKLPQGVGQSDPNYLLSFYRNAREYLENGDETSATQQLRQMEYAAATDPVRDTCESVITKLRKERADRDAAASAEVANTLKRVGQAVLAAKTAKDLDSPLQELNALTEKRTANRTYERGNDVSATRIQNAARFVTRWQDCLAASGRNTNLQNTDTLRTLSSETETLLLLNIPRSEIISRIPVNPSSAEPTPTPARRSVSVSEVNAAIEAALNRLKTLDDLAPVIHDLAAFRDEMMSASGYGNASNELTTTISTLQSLQQAYLEVQTGVNRWQINWPSRFDSSSTFRAENQLVTLRAQLIALSLPRILGSPDTEKPAPGERVDAFLDRLLAAAKKRGDWQAVANGVESRRLLAPNSAYDGRRSDYNAEESAFKQFFAGQNFEQAAQYEQAVAAYLSALGTGSQDIPVALISERLAAINKEHPAEYGGGTRASLPPGAEDYNVLRRVHRQAAEAALPMATATPKQTPTPAPTATPAPTPTPAATPGTSPSP